jgi:hypothetical protein
MQQTHLIVWLLEPSRASITFGIFSSSAWLRWRIMSKVFLGLDGLDHQARETQTIAC